MKTQLIEALQASITDLEVTLSQARDRSSRNSLCRAIAYSDQILAKYEEEYNGSTTQND